MEENTFSDYLVAMLFSARSTTIYRRILWEKAQKRKGINRGTFNQNLYRLRKRGVISLDGDKVVLKSYKKNSEKNLTSRISNSKLNGKQQILVSFDIPENKKKTRDWLRNQLKFWDFTMIQRSLWKGRGPLPKEFHERLKLLEIKDDVKILNIRSNNK